MNEDESDSVDLDSLMASIDDAADTITLSSWDSPLSTMLSGGYSTVPYPTSSISVGSIGTSGATLSTTNAGSLMWSNPTYTATAATPTYTLNPSHQGSLRVSGNAEFEGDIKIKGVNLSERLDAIEERLGILRPNNDLEGRWEKLKKLGEEYRKMEKEILEQENMWDILKK